MFIYKYLPRINSLFVIIAFASWCAAANSKPLITSVDINGQKISDNSQLTEGSIITIKGAGFGVKLNAAPILFDIGDEVYENGVLNIHHQSFEDGHEIISTQYDPNSIWEKPAKTIITTEGPAYAVQYSRNRRHRNNTIKGHYFARGPNSFVGWPKAYGGLNTPSGNKVLYVSWWLKYKYDPNRWVGWRYSSIQGDFQIGEEISLTSGQSGQILKIDAENSMIFADVDYYGFLDPRFPIGTIITGLASNAKAVISETPGIYTPGSNKFIRIWDNPSESFFRFSFTSNQFYCCGSYINKLLKEPAEIWHHVEIELDLISFTIKGKINGRQDYYLSNINPSIDANYSPTIALIGFNGSTQSFLQELDFGEIYMDNTFQRVILSDKKEWNDAESSHDELQMPIKWTENNIQFKLYRGAIKYPDKNGYLYVVDDKGYVNQSGIKLCIQCGTSPVSPIRGPVM